MVGLPRICQYEDVDCIVNFVAVLYQRRQIAVQKMTVGSLVVERDPVETRDR